MGVGSMLQFNLRSEIVCRVARDDLVHQLAAWGVHKMATDLVEITFSTNHKEHNRGPKGRCRIQQSACAEVCVCLTESVQVASTRAWHQCIWR